MNDLYEKLDILKKNLDQLSLFQNLELKLRKIKDNEELVKKIKKYHEVKSESLRLEIYQYPEIIEYKKIENEVNFLILRINQKLKEIRDDRGYQNACH